VSLTVDRILEGRARRAGRRPEAVSLAAAALLHSGALVLVLLLPRLAPPPPPLSFVPVQIIPAQALGVRRPASRPKTKKPAPPAPEPAKPEPAEPEPVKDEPVKPETKPETKTASKVRDDAPVLPDKTVKKPEKPQPPSKPPASGGTGNNPAGTAVQGTPDGEAGRRGGPTGNPLGTSAFGSEIAGLDNPDFKFGYYIDQLLGAIDAKWVRPPLGDGVRAIIAFRIERDGSLTDLQVAESSGYNSFDLAALRAVQHAAPFPPLPRAYRQDSLGVNLIVR
jgi:TonB family protein